MRYFYTLLLTLTFWGISFFAHGQFFFVGGDLGLSYTRDLQLNTKGETTENIEGTRTLFVSFNPGTGYVFNSRCTLGVSLGYSYFRSFTPDMNGKLDYTQYRHTARFIPYFNYIFLSFGRLAIYAHAYGTFWYRRGNVHFTLNESKVREESPRGIGYSLGVSPGVQYLLADHWLLYCALNAFGIEYSYSQEFSRIAGTRRRDIHHDFSLGLNTNSLLGRGLFLVGLSYSF